MAISISSNKRRQDLLPSEVTDNKEDIRLIWLDENMNDSPGYHFTQTMLLELNPAAQFYSNFDRCFDLIKSIKDEQIFLIISGTFAQRVLSQIHHQQTLIAIFIFCANRQHYESLMGEFNKIVEIFTDQESLLKSVREKMNIVEKQTLTFCLFDQKQKELKDLSKESASFLLNQMLIYVLRQMPQDEQSKKEMLNIYHDYYQNNKYELEKIKEFEENYNREKAIEWYTNECFLYRLLNKALRTDDIELLYTFRFFIIDLCAAIEDKSHYLKDKGTLILYRGTKIPMEKLQKLKENIGKIISINGFLSTSRNINVSLQVTHSNFIMIGFESVLFEIQANPSLKTVIFADVTTHRQIEGEERILFNLNSLFKIHSVNFDSMLNLWKVQLSATDEGKEKVEEYLALCKQQTEGYTPVIYFGRLHMNELGQIDRAGKYFNMLLKSLPSDHPDISAVYNNIANVHQEKREYNLALKNYEIAYEIRRKQLPPNHPYIAASLNNIGNIYKAKRNYDIALDYYQQALNIKEKICFDDNLQKVMMIENIGKVYTNKEDFDTALTYLSRALETFKRVLPDQHADIATCLGQRGYVYEKKGDLVAALDYYDQQLKMEEQYLPFDHPNLSAHLSLVVDIYKQMGEIEKGLEFCREKLNVQKNRLGENHPRIAQTLMIMANLCKDDNPDEALQYYGEALFILENSITPDHQITFDCLTRIAYLYNNYGQYEDGLKYQLKALDLARQTLSSDHINIAHNLQIIGLFYEKMNNPSEALRYFNESLTIYKLNYRPDHEKVTEVQNDIARLIDKHPSLPTYETKKQNIKKDTHFNADPLPSDPTSSSIAIVPEAPPAHVNNQQSSKPVKSTTCIIL
jgi:tetratricopeptide (TPR) repeat protein